MRNAARGVGGLLAALVLAACAVLSPSGAAASDGEWLEVAVDPPIDPPRVASRRAVYDAIHRRLFVFSGQGGWGDMKQMWILSLDPHPQWTRFDIQGIAPCGRDEASAIYDPVRDRLVVFGGFCNGSEEMNDVWALSLAGIPSWSQWFPSGIAPIRRFEHSAAYDPVGDRMIVFGGSDHHRCNASAATARAYSDTWALSLSGNPEWVRLHGTGATPPGRSHHAAVYDPVRRRMIMAGGLRGCFAHCDCGALFDDLWVLDLETSSGWSPLVSDAFPYPTHRWANTMVLDTRRNRILVYGGTWHNSAYLVLNDTWEIPLSRVEGARALSTEGVAVAQLYHAAFYDSIEDRMVVLGGYPRIGRISALLFPPTAPKGVRAVASQASVLLDWDPVEHPRLAGYRVRYWPSTDGGERPANAETINVPLGKSSLEVGCLGNREFLFEVEAVGSGNLESSGGPVAAARPGSVGGKLEVHPNALNPRAEGAMWASLELNPGFSAKDIIVSSVRLNENLEPDRAVLGDEDQDGRADLKLRFHRRFHESASTAVPLRVSGLVAGCGDPLPFAAEDTIPPVGQGTKLRAGAENDLHVDELPAAFEFLAPKPNPTGTWCEAGLDLPDERWVRAQVVDLQGRQVGSIQDGLMPAGRHRIRWDTSGVKAGIYFLRLEAGPLRTVARIAVLR